MVDLSEAFRFVELIRNSTNRTAHPAPLFERGARRVWEVFQTLNGPFSTLWYSIFPGWVSCSSFAAEFPRSMEFVASLCSADQV